MNNKRIVIFGGGALQHVFNHLSISAPAYGQTARTLYDLCEQAPNFDRYLFLSEMAANTIDFQADGIFETIEDLDQTVKGVIADPLTRIVFFSAAVPDWVATPHLSYPEADKWPHVLGKNVPRPSTKTGDRLALTLEPSEKLINQIRAVRKDIFLVGFSETTGATPQEQYEKALKLCKSASCNLVFANDSVTKHCMVICPEESAYHETNDKREALKGCLDMALLRSHLTFTRSTVVGGQLIPWSDPVIPENLKQCIEFCVEQGAYKPVSGITAGHFVVKVNDRTFITSVRKTDFNKIKENGMVMVRTDGEDTVIAYGAKPSVGGQSQRIVFAEHEGYDCILHFHCPLLPDSKVPTVSQREFECGSHQCGANTSRGLAEFELYGSGHKVLAVFLDNHGPNLVFSREVPAEAIIRFIGDNFDLSRKTGGYQLTEEVSK